MTRRSMMHMLGHSNFLSYIIHEGDSSLMLKPIHDPQKRYYRLMPTLFISYCILMIILLFFRDRHPHDSMRYNLILFHTIKQYLVNIHLYSTEIWVKNLFGNVILFIPLGSGIPTLYKRFMRVLPFTLLVIALLFSVEIIQMVTRVGSFDVDDILLNTIGALLGLGFTKFVYRIVHHDEVFS